MKEVQERKPFIPAEVYKEIEIFHQMCFDTYLARTYPVLKKPLVEGGREWVEHSNEAFEGQLDAIAKAIKARLKVVDA
jgi:hypothetical protein